MPKDTPEPERTFSQDEVNKIVQDRLARDREARVVHEPRVYAADSPDSYYLDTIRVALDPGALHYPAAHNRLNRYAVEIAHEIEARSAEGARAEKIIREFTRTSDKEEHERRFQRKFRETRSVVTTGGGATASAASSASVFVPPAFLQDAYALFRDTYRTFADQCLLIPLPAYGMQLYLPYFSTAAGASQQVEASGVSEIDPTTALQGSAVQTVDGQITITQQLLDRYSGGSGGMDIVISRQLQQHIEQKLDLFVLNQVIAGGASVTGSASLTANSWKEVYLDIAKGREQIADTAGIRLRPTHLFTTYDLYSGLTNIMATDGKPMQLPTYAPGFPITNGADDGLNGGQDMPKWSRFTGTVLPGGLLWFTDDNIPASGSNTQLLVSAPAQAVVVSESAAPVLKVYPQTYGNSLSVVVTLYKYVAAITRHAAGTAVITGAAYPTSLK